MRWHKRLTPYHIGVGISAMSVLFGILREFIIIALLGFTSKNDMLQLYLSIFYTIGLSIDAMRLSCLNLFNVLSLPQLVMSASIVSIPFLIVIACIMNYASGGLDFNLLLITLIGSYLNLIAALLITWKQRENAYLRAQFINVLPNFILIPGILLCQLFIPKQLVFSIITLTAIIPVFQCIALMSIPDHSEKKSGGNVREIIKGSATFLRHFSTMSGEQLFQIVTRTAFFRFGAGYLSLFTLIVRLYSAFRFILIDSYIGSKLFTWKNEIKLQKNRFREIIHSGGLTFLIALLTLLISLKIKIDLTETWIRTSCLLLFGFYFSAVVRILYFKINRHENNTSIIMRYTLFEWIFALSAWLISYQSHYPLLILLWIGFIAKPITQSILLRKKWILYEANNALLAQNSSAD